MFLDNNNKTEEKLLIISSCSVDFVSKRFKESVKISESGLGNKMTQIILVQTFCMFIIFRCESHKECGLYLMMNFYLLLIDNKCTTDSLFLISS